MSKELHVPTTMSNGAWIVNVNASAYAVFALSIVVVMLAYLLYRVIEKS
jgi:peptidoglycan/LPS O-acetylase OafA/YrhL